ATGSFGNISSAAVVAATSFSMTLTDPSIFLKKVDREVYWALTQKGPQKQINLAGVIYTEPQILMRRQDEKRVERSSNKRQRSDKTQWIISSKVQNIGDFIDTDAVRTTRV